jgi:F420H(2)-dependent quinone reductase
MAKQTMRTSGAKLERRSRVMKLVNVPMRALLGLPFKTPLSSRLMLVCFTGRRSGRAYRQPVSYVRDGGTLLTPGGGRWKLNLRDGESVELRLEGRHVVARPELVRDVEEVDRLVRLMVSVNQRLTSFVPFIERDGRIDRDTLETALGYGFCIVRWHIDGRLSL